MWTRGSSERGCWNPAPTKGGLPVSPILGGGYVWALCVDSHSTSTPAGVMVPYDESAKKCTHPMQTREIEKMATGQFEGLNFGKTENIELFSSGKCRKICLGSSLSSLARMMSSWKTWNKTLLCSMEAWPTSALRTQQRRTVLSSTGPRFHRDVCHCSTQQSCLPNHLVSSNFVLVCFFGLKDWENVLKDQESFRAPWVGPVPIQSGAFRRTTPSNYAGLHYRKISILVKHGMTGSYLKLMPTPDVLVNPFMKRFVIVL